MRDRTTPPLPARRQFPQLRVAGRMAHSLLPLVRSSPLAIVSKTPIQQRASKDLECDRNRKQTKKGNPMFIPSSTFFRCPHGACFNNWITRNGNIFPAWLEPLTVTFRKADRHDLMAGPPLWLITSDFYPGQGYIRIAKSLETLATWVIPRGKSSGTLAAHTLMRFFFSWDAQVMDFRLACFLLDSLYSVYFSFCWQQSTVPRNHFASLCSTWEHLNTFADGSEQAMNPKSSCQISVRLYKIHQRWL